MQIAITFDNYVAHPQLESFWGFSCLIDDNFLFDTGSNGRALLRNIYKMGYDLKKIKYLFISHPHWDHIGGIDSVVDENRDLTLFLPNSLSKFYIKDLKKLAKVEVISEFKEILPNFYSLGVMLPVGEQGLVITKDFPTLITGCAHPGVVNMVKKANENGIKILYVIGGFHLLNASKKEILEVIGDLKNLGVEYVTPTHCSGDFAIELFKKEFEVIPAGVGRIIEF